jgi:hypothetical protein
MSDAPRGRGRPPHIPTPEQRRLVQVLRSNGTALRVIARNLSLDVTTLRKAYKDELREGHESVVAAVGAAIVQQALNGNVHAAKYWLSTHGGPEWKIVEGRQIGGMPGADPIPIQQSGDSRVVIVLPDNGRDRATIGDAIGLGDTAEGRTLND